MAYVIISTAVVLEVFVETVNVKSFSIVDAITKGEGVTVLL